VQITLNKFKHVSYSVDDQERTSSNINLIERFAGAAAHALGLQIFPTLKFFLQEILRPNFEQFVDC
jgi:hypothetical protein